MTLAITATALLTPFDVPGQAGGSWQALRSQVRLGDRTAIDDRLLEGPETLDRSIRMALAAAKRVLRPSDTRRCDALFCGTSKGPVLTFLAAADRLRAGQALTACEARHVQLGTGAMGAFLAEHLGIRGPVHTSVAACASGLFALHRAAEALRHGACERALVVAADASLHPLFEASFARLGVLAPRGADGARRCEPFSAEGRGFFVSEAAVALVLERVGGSPPGPPPLACLDATTTAGDGTHLIAVDGESASLRAALRRVAQPPAIAFVHAHATGTAHDRHELEAIRAAIPSLPPERIFSHKAQLGHSLGAAGLVSVVVSAMVHAHGALPGGAPIERGASSLTIAQGFGGHIAVARLRSP